jgi:hypothetical protein
VCFEIIDDRVSSFRTLETRISTPRKGAQYFVTRLGIGPWLRDPGFWEKLVDGGGVEYVTRLAAGARMDAEFA